MSGWVLVVLWIGGGMAVHFDEKLACLDALQAVSSVYGKSSASAFLSAQCHPAGQQQGGKK